MHVCFFIQDSIYFNIDKKNIAEFEKFFLNKDNTFNEYYDQYKEYELNLSINDFIRTTEKRHHDSVKALWNKLVESDNIYLSKYAGWYSVSDEAYYIYLNYSSTSLLLQI